MKFTYRIKKSKTIKYVLKKGEYCIGEYISVHICKTKYYNDNNFFCVCVSKKNGNSVERNKIKRWTREVYKNKEMLLMKGYNIIVLYKKTSNIDNMNYHIVENDIDKCFKKLGIYEKNK